MTWNESELRPGLHYKLPWVEPYRSGLWKIHTPQWTQSYRLNSWGRQRYVDGRASPLDIATASQRWINYTDGRSSPVGIGASSLKHYSGGAAPVHLFCCSILSVDLLYQRQALLWPWEWLLVGQFLCAWRITELQRQACKRVGKLLSPV